ncbi:hypothetical protein MFIFM68171_05800 [Madurella fahalii]|uniref:Uncharacterized protein n=1 Tax=Madurella fahalii TaxID=1157608 RepID=A0ABQ0GCV1_9PEZI
MPTSTSSTTKDQAKAPVSVSTQEVVPTVPRPVECRSDANQNSLPENPTHHSQQPWNHPDTDTPPTIQNPARMMQALSELEPIYEQALPRHAPPASVDDTLVDNNDGREEDTQQAPRQVIAKSQAKVLNDSDAEALVKVFQIPAVLRVLRVLVALMNLLGYVSVGDNVVESG